MAATDPGPRDHLVTRALERALEQLDPETRVEDPLDPAEGPDRLARYAMEEIRRELSEDVSADDQASRINQVLDDLGGADSRGRELVRPPRILQGIKGRSPAGQVLPLPPAPATPFSQSDLLVNAEGHPGRNVSRSMLHCGRGCIFSGKILWRIEDSWFSILAGDLRG